MTRFSLQAVFIDSWAKMPENINDTLQQDAFERNTTTLWNLTTHFKPFAFKTLKVTQINQKEICVNVFIDQFRSKSLYNCYSYSI